MHRLVIALFAVLLIALRAHAEDWLEFRGPTGQGLSEAKNLPVEWDGAKNVVWKRAIPGRGWSSPIVHDGHVYLTTAVPGTQSPLMLSVLALKVDTGQIVGSVNVFPSNVPTIQVKNSHASPTPIIDNNQMFVHFGHHAIACLDLKGNIVWRNKDIRYLPVHGSGGSPVLAGNVLIVSVDGGNQAFVAALNRNTGQPVWKTDRKSKATKKFSFCTPLVIMVDGRQQVICPGSDSVIALDPADGKEIWRVSYRGYSVIPRPVYGNGLVYLCTGFNTPKLLAIRPDGKGNVTRSHIQWSATRSVPHTPSVLLVGDELYMISDRGVASCLDSKTGELHWSKRIAGNYSASPVHADGKIYFQSEEGVGAVIEAGTTFKLLAKNDIGERTLASYAIANGSIFLRTEGNLYRLQNR